MITRYSEWSYSGSIYEQSNVWAGFWRMNMFLLTDRLMRKKNMTKSREEWNYTPNTGNGD